MALTDEQLGRYARHIAIKGFGLKGQKALMAGSVLIIGAGGLGSPAALYLAAAGVGRIGIADPDVVELSNLQRQIIHSTSDIGRPKADSAADAMRALNPNVQVEAYRMRVDATNIADLIAGYDFVIDATDNYDAKFLINDACVLGEKPFCHGAAVSLSGQAMTYVPHRGPCYRCVFKEPPNGPVMTCKQAGIIGAVVGVIGNIQAMEAIKYLTGTGELLCGKLLVYEAFYSDFSVIDVPEADPECAVCGRHPTIVELSGAGQVLCNLDA